MPRLAAVVLVVLVAAGVAVGAALLRDGGGAPPGPGGQPVIDGLYPDPSVIPAGDGYVMAATSRDWLPAFPLFRSRDLLRWRLVGNVLLRRPAWTAGRYWAPELVPWGRGTRVYYTAETPDGRHCIGMASAPRATGPYRDRGPVLCPPDGAIDAAVATDAHGDRWLLYRRWRRAAIFARRLGADGTSTVGPRRLLLEPRPGDVGVVEGPEIVRRRGEVFLFFAAGKCCGAGCDYREEVARAPGLLGPYRRGPRPVMRASDVARCTGHGAVVRDPLGGWTLVYHGVAPNDPTISRRRPMVDRIRWDAAGWPLAGDDGTPTWRRAAPYVPEPRFVRGAPGPGGEWPPDRPARARRTSGGAVVLGGHPRTAELARQVPWRSHRARTVLVGATCAAGLATVESGAFKGVSTGLEVAPGGRVRLWRGRAGPGRTLATRTLAGAPYTLGVEVHDGRAVTLTARGARDRRAVRLRATTSVQREAIRAAYTCRGGPGTRARFEPMRVGRLR